jgi:DNA-binding CsgD family transcriptional regulator
MTDPISNLTDKEKEALRLLLGGHDAKSSATQLNLSIHTVNDRLRNARRKLGVSSSREAARILGDSVGSPPVADPQNHVHNSLGMAQPSLGKDTADLNKKGPQRLFGLTWLAGGMLIMSIVIASAVVSLYFVSGSETEAGHPVQQTQSVTNAKDEATSTDGAVSLPNARIFLAAVDLGDWQESWNAAGPYFQSQASAEEWSAMVEPVRGPLGQTETRRLVTVQRASTLPGAPDGEYEVLQFQTKFANRELIATETVIMLQFRGEYGVAGYFIR